MNHRGNTLNEWEKKTINRILPMKSFCYFLYLGALAQYIHYVKEGLKELNTIQQYAESLEDKKIKLSGPKTIRFMELSDEDKNKKRFNN